MLNVDYLLLDSKCLAWQNELLGWQAGKLNPHWQVYQQRLPSWQSIKHFPGNLLKISLAIWKTFFGQVKSPLRGLPMTLAELAIYKTFLWQSPKHFYCNLWNTSPAISKTFLFKLNLHWQVYQQRSLEIYKTFLRQSECGGKNWCDTIKLSEKLSVGHFFNNQLFKIFEQGIFFGVWG